MLTNNQSFKWASLNKAGIAQMLSLKGPHIWPIDFQLISPIFFLSPDMSGASDFGGESVLTNHRILGCCVPSVICDEGSFHQNWKQKNMGWANMGLKQHGDWTEQDQDGTDIQQGQWGKNPEMMV